VVRVLLVVYIHFLYVWLTYIVNILMVIKESQEKIKILKHHKTHRIFVAMQKEY